MGYRKTILATGEIYHVYNRGVEKRPLFLTKWDYIRFLDLCNYYRFANCPIKYSYFKLQSEDERKQTLKRLEKNAEELVSILSFCLMPNHIHFLLKQLQDNGISKFMAKLTNSYSHFFNTKQERVGHLFQGNFKAKRIESDEQLVHVSRYIHLNPVKSHIIKFDELGNYEYSSYPSYVNNKPGFTSTDLVLSYFKDIEAHKTFIKDQADYQQKLEFIDHLILEEAK